MSDPEPVVSDHPERQRYEIRVGDELGGFLDYARHGRAVDLIHTEIDPRFEGDGLGGRLAEGVFADLRRRGLQLIPTCPFIRAHLLRHPANLDLVVPDARRALEP